MFNTDFHCNETRYGLRFEIEIPEDLMILIDEDKILYNMNCPGDTSEAEEFFVDDSGLFIDIEKARNSGRFFLDLDMTDPFVKENTSTPEYIWLYDDMGFVNPRSYFDEIYKKKSGWWYLGRES